MYIPNGRKGDQARQSDDGQRTLCSQDATWPRYALDAGLQALGTKRDRQTDTVSCTVTDLSTDLHNTCGHRPQQGLDTRTVPAVRTALMSLYSQQPVQLQTLRRLCTFTIGQQPTDRMRRQSERCSRCHDLRKVATHTDPWRIVRSCSRSTNITRTGHHDCFTPLLRFTAKTRN